MPPPSRLKPSDVPQYISRTYGMTVTRQTVYNWIRNGKKGQKLRTTEQLGQLFTAKEWVNDFVSSL